MNLWWYLAQEVGQGRDAKRPGHKPGEIGNQTLQFGTRLSRAPVEGVAYDSGREPGVKVHSDAVEQGVAADPVRVGHVILPAHLVPRTSRVGLRPVAYSREPA